MIIKRLALVVLGMMCVGFTGVGCSGGSKEVKKDPFPQVSDPKKGEEIAVMETSMGTIKIRFFPEQAPKAVENFVTHSKNGYYNNTIFHRVMDGFMIQGGDPTGTGTGGESIWGGNFNGEISPGLHHFRGALSMANSGSPDTQSSQFFIVQRKDLSEGAKQQMESYRAVQDESMGKNQEGKEIKMSDFYPLPVIDKYVNEGGVPELDYGYTVFAQVIEGMDVVDAIASTPITPGALGDGSGKPVEDVIIKSITFEKY